MEGRDELERPAPAKWPAIRFLLDLAGGVRVLGALFALAWFIFEGVVRLTAFVSNDAVANVFGFYLGAGSLVVGIARFLRKRFKVGSATGPQAGDVLSRPTDGAAWLVVGTAGELSHLARIANPEILPATERAEESNSAASYSI